MDRAERLRSIFEEARRGDAGAANVLLDLSLARVRPWIRRMIGIKLGAKVEAEDLVQETAMQIWKEIGRLRWEGEGAYWRWLGKIARNCVHREANRLGAKKRSPDREVSLGGSLRSTEASGPILDGLLKRSGETPSKGLRRAERFERLENAFRTLPGDYRKVIVLATVKRMPMREVGERMGRTAAASSMLLLRAVRALGEAFGEIGSGESVHLPKDRSLGSEGGDRGERSSVG